MYLKKLLLSILCWGMLGFLLPMTSIAISEPKISISFVDIKVRDLLKVLAQYANKNIVINEKINGKITIDLQKVTWQEALNTILQMQGLTKHETNNIITVITGDELSKNGQTLVHPAIFHLRYVTAENIAKMLKPAGVLSIYGKLEADTASNSLIVADTNEKIIVIKELLKQIDVPAKQVVIEARIVSADESFLQELGLELNHVNGDRAKKNLLAPGVVGGQFNFAIAKLGNNDVLDLHLAALENSGKGKVISKPKLLAADRQGAYIEAGDEIPYQEKTKEGDVTVSFKKAVLSLKVIPEVVSQDAINLSLQLNQDKVGQLLVNGVPTIDTRKIHSQVLVHNGETIVFGDIYEWSKVNRVVGVPVLGQLPLIKIFFSRKETQMIRKELLIFVTPKIVR